MGRETIDAIACRPHRVDTHVCGPMLVLRRTAIELGMMREAHLTTNRYAGGRPMMLPLVVVFLQKSKCD